MLFNAASSSKVGPAENPRMATLARSTANPASTEHTITREEHIHPLKEADQVQSLRNRILLTRRDTSSGHNWRITRTKKRMGCAHAFEESGGTANYTKGLRSVSDGPDARHAINRDGGALSIVGRIGFVRHEIE